MAYMYESGGYMGIYGFYVWRGMGRACMGLYVASYVPTANNAVNSGMGMMVSHVMFVLHVIFFITFVVSTLPAVARVPTPVPQCNSSCEERLRLLLF